MAVISPRSANQYGQSVIGDLPGKVWSELGRGKEAVGVWRGWGGRVGGGGCNEEAAQPISVSRVRNVG